MTVAVKLNEGVVVRRPSSVVDAVVAAANQPSAFTEVAVAAPCLAAGWLLRLAGGGGGGGGGGDGGGGGGCCDVSDDGLVRDVGCWG